MPERAAKPSRMIPAEIQRIAFGVRYEPQLKLLDKFGTLTDEILRAEDTPFGPDIFPLSAAEPLQFRLLNPDKEYELQINSQDTILQMRLNTRNASRIDVLAEEFDEYVLNPLREIGGVKNIARYGVLFHFKETYASSLKNPPIARYISSDFSNANSLSMRFSRRLPVEAALAMKRIEDYRNAIYVVDQSDSGEVRISIDYQEYFQPLLDIRDWKERPFSAFVNRGTEYVEGEFGKWYDKFAVVSEVA
jgi:hypothetical protein